MKRDSHGREFVGRLPTGTTPSVIDVRVALLAQTLTADPVSGKDEPKAFLYSKFLTRNEDISYVDGNMKLFEDELPIISVARPGKPALILELVNCVNGVRSGPQNHEHQRDSYFQGAAVGNAPHTDALKLGPYPVPRDGVKLLFDIKGIEREPEYWDDRYRTQGHAFLGCPTVDMYDFQTDYSRNYNSTYFTDMFRRQDRGYDLDSLITHSAAEVGINITDVDLTQQYWHQELPITNEEKFYKPESCLYPFSRFRSIIVTHVDDYLQKTSRWLHEYELKRFDHQIKPRILEPCKMVESLITCENKTFRLVSTEYVGNELHFTLGQHAPDGTWTTPVPFGVISQLVYQSKLIRDVLKRQVKPRADPIPQDIDERIFKQLLEDSEYLEVGQSTHAAPKFKYPGLF